MKPLQCLKKAFIPSVPHVGGLIISSNVSFMFYEMGERGEKPLAVAVCVSMRTHVRKTILC